MDLEDEWHVNYQSITTSKLLLLSGMQFVDQLWFQFAINLAWAEGHFGFQIAADLLKRVWPLVNSDLLVFGPSQ